MRIVRRMRRQSELLRGLRQRKRWLGRRRGRLQPRQLLAMERRAVALRAVGQLQAAAKQLKQLISAVQLEAKQVDAELQLIASEGKVLVHRPLAVQAAGTMDIWRLQQPHSIRVLRLDPQLSFITLSKGNDRSAANCE